MVLPATGGRIAGTILAGALGLAIAASALAEPTKVTEIKGKKLNLYSEAGKRIDSMSPKDVPLPLDILGVSDKGMFLVEIPGKRKLWIWRAQTVTDEGLPEVPVDCQSLTENYNTSRGFGDCN